MLFRSGRRRGSAGLEARGETRHRGFVDWSPRVRTHLGQCKPCLHVAWTGCSKAALAVREHRGTQSLRGCLQRRIQSCLAEQPIAFPRQKLAVQGSFACSSCRRAGLHEHCQVGANVRRWRVQQFTQ